MTPSDYLKQSERTAKRGPLSFTAVKNLFELLKEQIYFQHSGVSANITKRSLFYKKNDYSEVIKTEGEKTTALFESLMKQEETLNDTELNQNMIDLIHAELGIRSECCELSQAICASILDNKELDKVNLQEELGDLLWYIALAARAIGTDFETLMEKNIEKLKVRFPDKFTEEKAVERDLFSEREVLENETV